MKEKLLAFIHGLTNYDYALFGGIFIVFLLLLLTALLLRKKHLLSIIILLLSMITIFIGPVVGYIQLHKTLYKHSCKITDVKELQFTPAVVVTGTLTNESKRDFHTCKITVKLYKVSHNAILDRLFMLNPFQKMSIIEKDILKNETRAVKIIVEPFDYKNDYNVSMGADCR
ncbi:DUF2393 family protein [Sulfurimonas sp. HSL-1716]|uniref:DUF2393 family protein n=1 Tax=Hydrocurvibacter sulfurireducens TaxID=3131937 RepID=UPI0031F8AC05